jgi:hypothetical protein
LKTRSWERAEVLKRALEGDAKEPKAVPKRIPVICEAVDKFLADAEHGRKFSAGTIK